MAVFLCGFMGCGKSTVGRRLAEKLGRKFIDMDKYIEKAVGCPITYISVGAERESIIIRGKENAR